MFGRIDVDRLHALQDLAGGGVDVADRFHLITEQLNAHQAVFVGGPDLEHIPFDAKTAAGDFGVVAAVLVVDQLPQRTPQIQGFANTEWHGRLEVFRGNPKAVDAADRSNDDHIAAFKQRTGR